MASGAAAAAVQVGEMAELLPKSRQALEAGRIGLAHLTLIAYTARFIGEGFREDQLLAKAEKLPVTTFGRVCTHYRHAASPEGFAREERELHEARFLELTTNAENGSVWLRGFFDAEGGAHLKTAIDSLAQPLPQDDRTAGQRRADALVEISRASLDAGRLPEVNGVRPHLQVSATLETLLGMAGAPAAELEGAGPISGRCCNGWRATARCAGSCSARTRW